MVPLSLETGGRKLLELAQSHHGHQSAFRAYKVCSQSIQSLVNKVKNQSKIFIVNYVSQPKKCPTQVGRFFVFILKVIRRGKSSKDINGL